MEQHLGRNARSPSFWDDLAYLWKSPRGSVIRIEALALVAIVLFFFLATYGSRRRRSDGLMLQKGVLAANVLSVSLGTYSIGLMQSSSVKSEMYPIWGVSLITLFGCVDSFLDYSRNNTSQPWSMLYQLGLYFGYVLVISISSISSPVGNIAIAILSGITLIKGLHKSCALGLPRRMQKNMVKMIARHMQHFIDPLSPPAIKRESVARDSVADGQQSVGALGPNSYSYVVHWPLHLGEAYTPTMEGKWTDQVITMDKIWQCQGGGLASDVGACKDVCLSLALSHLLQRRLLGLGCAESGLGTTRKFVCQDLLMESNGARAFKVIDMELAFLYDVFCSSNAYRHYYESKVSSILALASFLGTCFIVVVSVIPGTRATRASGPDGATAVNTPVAEIIATLLILVCLAYLQMHQLLRCWASNWARVAFACEYVSDWWQMQQRQAEHKISCLMKVKACILRMRWLDNHQLWKNKMGQHSLYDSILRAPQSKCSSPLFRAACISKMPWFQCIKGLVGETCSKESGQDVDLDADVKAKIVEYLTKGYMVSNGYFSLRKTVELFQQLWAEGRLRIQIGPRLFSSARLSMLAAQGGQGNHTAAILVWHIATCYCEEKEREQQVVQPDTNRRVATALSKYCTYLVVSKPELLPGWPFYTRSLYDEVADVAAKHPEYLTPDAAPSPEPGRTTSVLKDGIALGCELFNITVDHPSERWEQLAAIWVETTLSAALSDKAEEHIKQLSQGGEFITHLWALLSHAGILTPEDVQQ